MNDNIYILMNSVIKKNCMKWNARHFMVTEIEEIVEIFTFLDGCFTFVNITCLSTGAIKYWRQTSRHLFSAAEHFRFRFFC